MTEIVADPVNEDVETISGDSSTSEDDTQDQSFDDYLKDVIETNSDVNVNLDKTNDELTDVTEQLETLLQVFDQQAKQDEKKQVKDSLSRENDLKFREKVLQELSGDTGNGREVEILEYIDYKLNILTEHAEVSKTTDLTIMIYGLIIIPFIMICLVLWKTIKSFI